MKNFNMQRFMDYARYDSTINKTYYRNMSLMAVLTLMGLTLVGFIGRWGMYKMKMGGSMGDPTDATITIIVLVAAASILTTIFAGCTFHNLRTKQGRIFELTLPASTLEKYVWHLMACIVGGHLVCCAGIVLSDVLNAILGVITYPLDQQFSLIAQMFHDTRMMSELSAKTGLDSVLYSLGLVTLCYTFFSLSFYVLGNSFKYRYNVILTYAVQQALSFVLYIILIIMGAMGWFKDFTPGNFLASMDYSALVCFLLGILCFWYAYVRFGKAVVTSRMNK